MSESGLYIVIEGNDGTGKTTVTNIMADRLRQKGHEVIRIDEPDSAYNAEGEILAPIASELRSIIKNASLGRAAMTNVLLFTAARAENYRQVIKPTLKRGAHVLSARSHLSSHIYQGMGEGVDRALIDHMTHTFVGEDYMRPDHVFILDLLDEAERQKRIASRGELETPDTFESKGSSFQERINQGYRQIGEQYHLPLIPIDGMTPDEIADLLLNRVNL